MDKDTETSVIASGGYLEQFGRKLIENGYSIVPIEPGKKAPGYDDWQKTRSSSVQLNKWLEAGRGGHGVGIITVNTPAVDIDVVDDELAQILEDWCTDNLGAAPTRVGQAPKRLLLYRTDEPFRKITSRTYLNEWDERCRVEILGDGQQFVGFHVHPGTKKPYRWVTEQTPLNTPADELVLIDGEKLHELVRLFEDEAEKRGWKMAKGSRIGKGIQGTATVDRDDPFAADIQPVNMSPAEIGQRLMMAPGAEDYDTWLQVGMALFHQFDGQEIGREMWHEWSETAENYDAEQLDRKWSTFDISDKRRAPITARLILQLAKEAAESKAIATASTLKDRFATARDRAEWNEIAKEARAAEIDHLSRGSLAEVARESLQKFTGGKVSLPDVKKALAYEINTKETPRWCRDWVYDVSEDKFFHTIQKYSASPQGFNAMNDRHAMTKKDVLEGKTAPTASASHLALNLYKVPVVKKRLYSPGSDSIFMYEGDSVANTYPENQVPARPKTIRPIDKLNVKLVKAHVAHLFPNKKDQIMLLDWLSFVVQNPGKRVNYAPLIQGVQGDGKSFFASLLAAVMGRPNVRMGNAHILEGAFTGWAEGQCVMAIEEIRLVGHNRHDVLNRIKPLITNDEIEIHAKGRNPYNVHNTTNYILFTNYRDAMPLSENERRFLVMFSQWQSADQLRHFKAKNPDYYLNLYGALEDSAAVLRVWLLERDLSEDFNPRGDAPLTSAFHYMVNAAQPAEIRLINEIIEGNEYPDISNELLNITLLQSLDTVSQGDFSQAKTLEKMLEQAGFWPLGRIKIDGSYSRFYSKNPVNFQSPVNGRDQTNPLAIRKFLRENGVKDEDDEM